MIEIKPGTAKNSIVSVPGSKSYSHRILIAAALSDGSCSIGNCLVSEDTRLTMGALRQMGIDVQEAGQQILVQGVRGALKPCPEDIFLGNSGTSMRLLTAVAAMGSGKYRLSGTPRMHQRPIQDLIDGLRQLGVEVRSIQHNGCPPLEITGGRITGGQVSLNCSTSSQYLSALLLIAPYTQDGLEINVTHGPVSRPYIDMTVDVMEKLGVEIRREGYGCFQIAGKQCYRSGNFVVEPDASQAGYFWAAAAVTGTAVKVKGIFAHSTQGDAGFTRILEAMGCRVYEEADGLKVIGGPLHSVEADMGDMPDLVPTLAVVAAFAAGTTIIRNVGHLKAKESDRLASVAAELNKMGIEADCSDTELRVKGGAPRGATIETYDDHRMAMSFAVAGLRVPGVVIQDERCVNKSFPGFWDVLHTLQDK